MARLELESIKNLTGPLLSNIQRARAQPQNTQPLMSEQLVARDSSVINSLEPNWHLRKVANPEIVEAVTAFKELQQSATIGRLNNYKMKVRNIRREGLAPTHLSGVVALDKRLALFYSDRSLPEPNEVANAQQHAQASTSRQTPQHTQPLSPSNTNWPLSPQFSSPAAQSPPAQSPAPHGEQVNANPPGRHRVPYDPLNDLIVDVFRENPEVARKFSGATYSRPAGPQQRSPRHEQSASTAQQPGNRPTSPISIPSSPESGNSPRFGR
jgi:hypothetical protein